MKQVQRLTALGLCAALMLSLSACRYSDVLEQIIYNLNKDLELDYEAPYRQTNNVEDGEISDLQSVLDWNDEAMRTQYEPPELREEGEEAEEDGASFQLSYQPDSEREGEAPVSEVTTPDRAAETSQETSRSTDADGSGEGSGGIGRDGQSYDVMNGASTAKQLVDAYGNQVEIPADVDQVAAVGNMAVMVMMLGGAERLAAANSGLTGDSALNGVFPGLSDVSGLWSGEGGAPLSEENFQTLLELAPDVVLEISGSGSVSNSQAERLKEAGISYLVLPAPTSLNNIKTAMTSLGTVLGDKSGGGGANAPQIAADYAAWVDGAVDKVSQATDSQTGMYTLYIDGWDDEAYYCLGDRSNVSRDGYGAAFINNNKTPSCQAITNYLGIANITNTAGYAGAVLTRAQYFTPLFGLSVEMEVTGAKAVGVYTRQQRLLEPAAGTVLLGTSNFPILLAADLHVKQAIEADRDSGEGLWSSYGAAQYGGLNVRNGYLDDIGNLVASQIAGDYEVVVNPCGLCSWTQGSAESILESVWAAWRFFGTISEEEMRSCISDFYSQFYGCTLSNSEIDHILEGK